MQIMDQLNLQLPGSEGMERGGIGILWECLQFLPNFFIFYFINTVNPA